ncbi:MAG: hypothetical protein ABFR89_02460 [Actinomycetota bacterium]
MLEYLATLSLPTTWQGAVGLVAATLTVASIILGVTVRLARAHIDRRVDEKCDEAIATTVGRAVKSGIAPLEAKIDNGLTDRQVRIEEKVDRLIDHLLERVWDGRERRDGE